MSGKKYKRICKILLLIAVSGSCLALIIFYVMFWIIKQQTNMVVGRVRTDLRTLSKSIDEYYLKNNAYPPSTNDLQHSAFNRIRDRNQLYLYKEIPSFENADGRAMNALTTPVAYACDYYSDPCVSSIGAPFAYFANSEGYVLWSAGIDGEYDLNMSIIEKNLPLNSDSSLQIVNRFSYDPSNGLGSKGDILLMQLKKQMKK